MPDQAQNVRILRFVGKISWEGQANGLPPEIFSYIFFDARYSSGKIAELIEQQLSVYRLIGGMPVEKNQGAVIDVKRSIVDRMIVPWHWIVYIHPEVITIPGDTPLPDEDGVERQSDGTQALKN